MIKHRLAVILSFGIYNTWKPEELPIRIPRRQQTWAELNRGNKSKRQRRN